MPPWLPVPLECSPRLPRLYAYKIGSHYLEAIILTPSPLVVYRDVLTLDITAFIESMEIQSADALPLSATSSANNSESRCHRMSVSGRTIVRT